MTRKPLSLTNHDTRRRAIVETEEQPARKTKTVKELAAERVKTSEPSERTEPKQEKPRKSWAEAKAEFNAIAAGILATRQHPATTVTVIQTGPVVATEQEAESESSSPLTPPRQSIDMSDVASEPL